MRTFKTISALLTGLFLAVPAFAHETGVAHPHDGNVLHPIFGIDHLLIVLAVAAVAAIIVWRSR
jgi:hydrogenase/urease accessory protein HupE